MIFVGQAARLPPFFPPQQAGRLPYNFNPKPRASHVARYAKVARVKRKFRAVLFDLDGTLADTLADLANAMNWALRQLGCPAHPLQDYRRMVGDGARELCRRALPAGRTDLLEEALRLMRGRYAEHWHDETRLYAGVKELSAALSKRGYSLAVLSNKPDDFTKQIVAHFFRPNPFHVVRGQLPGVLLKPDPTAALNIAGQLAVPAEEWTYLGDTNTDMRTATAAGMFPVGVLWGFRDRQELEQSGAEALVERPAEVLKFL
jgi:phosphoglycolate phosphatase